MPTRRFKIGDGVQLVSGSPHMTVIRHLKNEEVECCWFDREGRERRSIFPQNALVSEKLDDLSDEDLKRRINKTKSIGGFHDKKDKHS